MLKQPSEQESLYNQKIRSLFTQLICETESLYEKVVNQQNCALKEMPRKNLVLQHEKSYYGES